MKPYKYKLSSDECDKICIHSLRYYKELVNSYEGYKHPDDVIYEAKLVESIDFLLKYLGG